MNQALFQYLNNFAGKFEWFDTLAIFSAEYLGWWLLAGVVVLIWTAKRDRLRNILFVSFSVSLAWLIAKIIKYLYPVARPFLESPDAVQLIVHGGYDSFPSGHAAFFFALAMAVYFFHKRWSVLFFAGAALIGIGRVIGGIHWPLDILAGAVVGILSALIIYYIFVKSRAFNILQTKKPTRVGF